MKPSVNILILQIGRTIKSHFTLNDEITAAEKESNYMHLNLEKNQDWPQNGLINR